MLVYTSVAFYDIIKRTYILQLPLYNQQSTINNAVPIGSVCTWKNKKRYIPEFVCI